MGRWSQCDDDDHRLPEGMQRVGYDADTQIYTYQDEDGNYWEGSPGARYGSLTRVQSTYELTTTSEHVTLSKHHLTQSLHTNTQVVDKKHAWRLFAPFLLLVGLTLLLLFRLLGTYSAPDVHLPQQTACGEHESLYSVRTGDTCWAIAERYGMKVEKLLAINEEVACDSLRIEQKICAR